MTVLPVVATAAKQLSVVVASKNAVKINAVAAALRQALPGVQHHIRGSESVSGVPDQPWGDAETLAGALNRVASIAHLPQHCGSLLVAIEGGVGPAVPLPPPAAQLAELQHGQQPEQQRGRAAAGRQRQDWQRQPQQPPPPQQQQLECFAWVVVQSPCGATSHARSASFPLPPALSELILRDGLELGAADDAVFGRIKSGQGTGTIGKLTGGLLTRQLYYEHAALCALVPLMNPGLYQGFDLAQLPVLADRPDAAAAGGE